MTPFLLINGPVRHTLDINSGIGCLGPQDIYISAGLPQTRVIRGC